MGDDFTMTVDLITYKLTKTASFLGYPTVGRSVEIVSIFLMALFGAWIRLSLGPTDSNTSSGIDSNR